MLPTCIILMIHASIQYKNYKKLIFNFTSDKAMYCILTKLTYFKKQSKQITYRIHHNGSLFPPPIYLPSKRVLCCPKNLYIFGHSSKKLQIWNSAMTVFTSRLFPVFLKNEVIIEKTCSV